MSYVTTKGKFHCALNGVGLLLHGAPASPAYSQNQSPVYGTRFASGDRDYNDLSQWWYWHQTDFSGGIKDMFPWLDDARFFSSTNIDTWSVPGTMRLAPLDSSELTSATTSEDFLCGTEGDAGGTVYPLVGTDDDTNSRPQVYKKSGGSWTSVTGTTLPTSQNAVSQVLCRLSYAWFLTVGNGATYVVSTWDGSSIVDQSAYIDAKMTGAISSCRCGVSVNDILYLLMNDSSNNQHAMVKTSVASPASADDWTLVFEKSANNGTPVDSIGYNGYVYYLLYFSTGNYVELWAWDIANSTNTLIQKFANASISQTAGLAGKLLVNLNGKIVITIPYSDTAGEVWEMSGSSISRIFKVDKFKSASLNKYVDSCSLLRGGVLSDNKIWWGNLMYDGTTFYNTIRPRGEGADAFLYPVFALGAGSIYATSATRFLRVFDPLTSSSFRDNIAAANYLVFSNFDNISGIDKLAYSITLIFDKLVSGQEISIEYSTDQISSSMTWTALGTASYAVDGGTIQDKKFFFAAGTTFKKIWFRVKMASGGSNTPSLNDIVMEYLPMPTYKKSWTLNINAGDDVKRLDGILAETTGRELKSLIETAWWTKSVLDFQDLDYATTTLSDDPLSSSGTTITVPINGTQDFPEQGRIRIDDEEILYTGKTPATFTGCVRGARGTYAVSHLKNAVINNAFKIIVADFQSRVPVLLKDKMVEYTIGVTLREA